MICVLFEGKRAEVGGGVLEFEGGRTTGAPASTSEASPAGVCTTKSEPLIEDCMTLLLVVQNTAGFI